MRTVRTPKELEKKLKLISFIVRQWLLWGLWGLQKESEIKLVMVLPLAGLLVQWWQKRHVWIFSDCFSNPHCPHLPISSVCVECIFKLSQILFQVLTVLTVITVLLIFSLVRTLRTPKELEKKWRSGFTHSKTVTIVRTVRTPKTV